MFYTITTDRLVLRPPEEADARRIAYLVGDYDVARMCGRVPHPYSLAAAHDFIGTQARSRELGSEYSFAVTAPFDGLIGSCGISRIGATDDGVWEIGYWLGLPYWGLGYASEAARAVMLWARDQLGATRFAAGHFADNPASGNVLRKLGFVRTGTQELFGLARQGHAPAERYVWPEGAPEVSLAGHHGAQISH